MKKLYGAIVFIFILFFGIYIETNATAAEEKEKTDITNFFNHLATEGKNGECKIEVIDKYIESSYATFAYNNFLLDFFDKATQAYGSSTEKYTKLNGVLNSLKGLTPIKNNPMKKFIVDYLSDLFTCKENSL